MAAFEWSGALKEAFFAIVRPAILRVRSVGLLGSSMSLFCSFSLRSGLVNRLVLSGLWINRPVSTRK